MRPARLRGDLAATTLLAVFATCVGWALRLWNGYPLNPSDERNWIDIAARVAQGIDWPISGALHFAATRALANEVGISHADALATLGVASIPLVLLAYAVSYRLMGIARTSPALLLLCTSTYFWAPLLESRPQQWGQALVALCAAITWRGLRQPARPMGWRPAAMWVGWGLLFLLTCWVHLLSGPIAFGLCGLLALACLALWPMRWRLVLGWALACVPGLLVLILPQGPYRTMLLGLGPDYLSTVSSLFWLAALAGLVLAAVLLVGIRALGPAVLAAVLRSVERSPRCWALGLSTALFGLLAAQARMLPADAWVFYHGSVAVFVLKQSGNLLFLGLLMAGLLHVVRAPGTREAAPWPGQLALLAAMAWLALMALALSAITRDSNWMLRIINYTLPFAAPLAAVGLAQWRWADTIKWGLVLLAALISLGTAGNVPFLA